MCRLSVALAFSLFGARKSSSIKSNHDAAPVIMFLVAVVQQVFQDLRTNAALLQPDGGVSRVAGEPPRSPSRLGCVFEVFTAFHTSSLEAVRIALGWPCNSDVDIMPVQ